MESRHDIEESNSEKFNQQLLTYFPEDKINQTQQICYLVINFNDEDNDYLFSPLEQNKLEKWAGLLYTFFSTTPDIQHENISSLKLACNDTSIYFDGKFNGSTTLGYCGNQNVKRALKQSVAVIIFSDDIKKINVIGNEIIKFAQPYHEPFIFLAYSDEHLDINKISIPHTMPILCGQINSEEKALAFWETIRHKLDELNQQALLLRTSSGMRNTK